MELPPGYVELGRLGRTFQLQGGVRFYPVGAAEAQAIEGLRQVWLSLAGPADIRAVRRLGDKLILYFARALTVDDAKPLVNQTVYAPRAALPRAAGVPYRHALVGLPVYCEGAYLGEVCALQAAGLQDLLVVATATGELLLPLQAPYVALHEDRVQLSGVPEGLID